MRKRRGPAAALLALLVSLEAPTSVVAEPVEGQDPATRSSIEMAGHRRLSRVMAEAGYRATPFVTDGCSGGLSLAWGAVANYLPPLAGVHDEYPPWEACCVTHDRAYHVAGGARTAQESYRARLSADEALRDCVLDTGVLRSPQLVETYDVTDAQVAAAYALIADAMFNAVRLGGGPCSALPWRWGYGYPGCLWPN